MKTEDLFDQPTLPPKQAYQALIKTKNALRYQLHINLLTLNQYLYDLKYIPRFKEDYVRGLRDLIKIPHVTWARRWCLNTEENRTLIKNYSRLQKRVDRFSGKISDLEIQIFKCEKVSLIKEK